MKKVLVALVLGISLMACEKQEEPRKDQAKIEVQFGYTTDEPVKNFVIEQSFDGYEYKPAIAVVLRPYTSDFTEVIYVNKESDKVYLRVTGNEEDGGYVRSETAFVSLK